MIRLLFICVSFIFCFIACSKTASPSTEKKQITEKVNQLYNQYGKTNEDLYNKPFSEDLFSPDLKKVLENAVNASKKDIEKIKSSDHPDEKPLIFEGAMFSSLYEGYTTYKIQSVDIHNNSANVFVQFEYNDASPKITWTDKIHLIDSGNGWRIDNIIFDKIANSKDLKTNLTDFAKGTEQ